MRNLNLGDWPWLILSGSVIEYTPGDIVDKAIEKLTDRLREDLDRAADRTHTRTDPEISGIPDPGWDLLNKADFMSARQFLRA